MYIVEALRLKLNVKSAVNTSYFYFSLFIILCILGRCTIIGSWYIQVELACIAIVEVEFNFKLILILNLSWIDIIIIITTKKRPLHANVNLAWCFLSNAIIRQSQTN